MYPLGILLVNKDLQICNNKIWLPLLIYAFLKRYSDFKFGTQLEFKLVACQI